MLFRSHYLPDFECCRNCAVHQIENADWKNARGVLTFNEQMKEFADEFNQLELIMISPSPELRALAQVLVLVALSEAGFKLIEEGGEEDGLEEDSTFMKIETGFLVWSKFHGKAKIHSSVTKAVTYDLEPKRTFADSGLVKEFPADYSVRKIEEGS